MIKPNISSLCNSLTPTLILYALPFSIYACSDSGDKTNPEDQYRISLLKTLGLSAKKVPLMIG